VEQKLLQTSADTTYPAVFGLFQDTGNVAANDQITCDRELLSNITTYIERSAAQLGNIDQNLTTALANYPRVILWGAGQLAMKLLALPSLTRTEVRALVDNNPALRGKTFRGAPVVGPKDMAGSHEPIVIATLLHDGEISAQIRRLGLENPVITLLPTQTAESGRT
jgi:FlaA1/EpsC-like NDP-sugar epimerase